VFQARVDTPTIGLTDEQRKKVLLEALEKALRDKDEPRVMELIPKLHPLTKPSKIDTPTIALADEQQKKALMEALEKALQAKDEGRVMELIRALPPLTEPPRK
jgi:uncharacterized protein YpiB (UPF0302 family)